MAELKALTKTNSGTYSVNLLALFHALVEAEA
jgi:hypothetical protein